MSIPQHSSRRYQCLTCGVCRSKLSLILQHLHCHPDASPQYIIVGKDRRRYPCTVCGIVRSKLCMLRKHMLSHNLEPNESSDAVKQAAQTLECQKRKRFNCEECGLPTKKPATLQQHLLIHSNERPFVCPKDGCVRRYKRQDHLKRHLLGHNKSLFQCSWPGCIMMCSNGSNLKRHLRNHARKGILQRGCQKDIGTTKVVKCPEPHCQQTFRYPSNMRSHHDVAHAFQYAEILCGEPGCGERFAEPGDLRKHLRSSHMIVHCELCNVSLSRKSYKRHLKVHEAIRVKCTLQCPFESCACSFANSSNLATHVKVVHMGAKDYKCTFEGCGRSFGYKHTRDMHEKRRHSYIHGDFLEEDLKFQSRARGGRKAVFLKSIDDLFRKRVVGPKLGEGVMETSCDMK